MYKMHRQLIKIFIKSNFKNIVFHHYFLLFLYLFVKLYHLIYFFYFQINNLTKLLH